MEIAPIAGVRAISPQRQPKTANSSQPQFKIDASERTEDDTWSPDHRYAEDAHEEPGSDMARHDDSEPSPESTDQSVDQSTNQAPAGSTINVIA